MSIISQCSNRNLFYSVLLIVSGALAGCTTVPPAELCSPKEQKQLRKQLLITRSLLDRNETNLSVLRKTATQDRCLGTLFAPAAKSEQCTKLLTKMDRLTAETRTLHERVHELNMALAGRTSPSRHVKSCKASWVVVPKKVQPKAAYIPQRKIKTPARPITKSVATVTLPVYQTVAPVKAEEVNYKPSPITQTSNAPTYVAPVTSTPPAERAYTANTKVRVVGSEFFPDQSALASQPTPDHAPAP
ncbi:hypothetical protein FHW72_000054 [Ochrobactrum sp. RC6B]|nr:hypothetical protein [Ochrobactrum sp. RC6B]